MIRTALTALALMIAAPLAAPLAAQTQAPVLTLLDGAAPGFDATLSLENPGFVQGNAPCNHYSARLTGTLPAFRVEAILSTKMACPDLAAEQRFFEVLSLMGHAVQEGDLLTLTGAGHEMVFSSQP